MPKVAEEDYYLLLGQKKFCNFVLSDIYCQS